MANKLNLFSESLSSDVEIFEESSSNKKDLYIEGIFAQADIVNGNGRIYPSKVLMPAVEKYISTRVDKKNALGELDHPDRFQVDSKQASHLITDLRIEGSNVYGKAKILTTSVGREVRALMSDGVNLAVSTRGAGKSKRNRNKVEEMELFVMSTVDIVMTPSAPSAYVNGVNESVEFLIEEGLLDRNTFDKYAKKRISEDEFQSTMRQLINDIIK